MRWIDDPTGRFPARPFYETTELDALGARLAGEGARGPAGGAPGPLDTDALVVLVEGHVGDLDLYADLEAELGRGIEAVTEFRPGETPVVRVERRLAIDPRRHSRFRFTLAHELGHVVLHRDLWERRFAQPALLPGVPAVAAQSTGTRGNGQVDWLEWQAGQLAAALLMPAPAFAGLGRPPFAGTPEGDRLADAVARAFGVSAEAAEARLRRLGRLRDPDEARQGRLWRE